MCPKVNAHFPEILLFYPLVLTLDEQEPVNIRAICSSQQHGKVSRMGRACPRWMRGIPRCRPGADLLRVLILQINGQSKRACARNHGLPPGAPLGNSSTCCCFCYSAAKQFVPHLLLLLPAACNKLWGSVGHQLHLLLLQNSLPLLLLLFSKTVCSPPAAASALLQNSLLLLLLLAAACNKLWQRKSGICQSPPKPGFAFLKISFYPPLPFALLKQKDLCCKKTKYPKGSQQEKGNLGISPEFGGSPQVQKSFRQTNILSCFPVPFIESGKALF